VPDGNERFGDFSVHGIGWREVMPPVLIDRPCGTPDYLMMRFDSTVTCRLGGRLEDCAPGSFVVWAPGEAQLYGNREAGFVHSWIHCSGAFVDKVLKVTGVGVLQRFIMPHPERMDDTLRAIHDELTVWDTPEPVLVRHLFEDWLRRVGRDLLGQPKPLPPAGIATVKARMDQEPSAAWSLEELARMAGYSKEHFGVQFRKHYGVSPIAYLLEIRLRNAARLLMDPRQRVSEVSELAGFDDPFYFSRMFRKRFGASPRQWRSWQRGG